LVVVYDIPCGLILFHLTHIHCFSSQGLTQVEEMLIAAVMPIMSVYCLPQSGHVINLFQDVVSFARMLCHLFHSTTSVANVETDPAPSDEELYDSHLPQSFVPSTSPSMTEQEAVCHSVQQRQSTQLDTFWAPFHSMS